MNVIVILTLMFIVAILTDYKYYKWIAIIPGWYIGEFVGAIVSYFLVDALIKGITEFIDEDVEAIMSNKREDLSFDLALLRICTLLIQADGKVEPEEVKVVREFFIRTFGKRKSEKVFKEIKTSYLRNSTIDQLVTVLKLRLSPTKYYSVIQILYAVAASDGVIAKNEDLFIEDVAVQFGFSKERLQSIRNQFIKTKTSSKTYSKEIMNALNILGLKPGVNSKEIKTAYRKLAKEYHPDKLTGMSEGIKELAKEKFQMIQEAYEHLNKNYV